ncbi:GEVED domain-containing protein [Arthrobacter sp. R1-13]
MGNLRCLPQATRTVAASLVVMLLLGLLTFTNALTTAVPASAAVSAACSLAQNGSFETPNIQDPDNRVAGDAYISGYNMFRTSQATMSGWSTVAGTVDILRYYNNASDGDQSIDLWGTAPATMEQTFTGLVPGAEYTFSIDYSGLQAGASRGSVLLSQGGPFTSLATLSPSTNGVLNGSDGLPETRHYTVTWQTFTHTFTATGTSATIHLQNQTAPAMQNTGLFVDNFRFGSDSPCQDFGDAPTGTLQADDGPSHIVPGFDSVAGTAPLMLGASIDLEDDGQPNASATGDGADENGITGPVTLNPGATGTTLPVSVTNSSGAAATLYGWIDANDNGSFEANEFASVAVPSGATSASLDFSGLAVFQDGATPPIRLRLTTDQLLDDPNTPAVDERALGAATDGEVEDYLARVATLVPVSCAAPFVETFGAGTGYGAPLPGGQTTYLYEGSAAVNDGEYALLSALPGAAGGWWHTASDHTMDDANGRMMVINASFTPGLFFQRTFTGLVPGTTYDFAAWITNANNVGSPILPNVKFRVVDPATGVVLSELDTGDIAGTSSLEWHRFALQFAASQSTVRLELMNSAPGGSGNDLAIDDISFMPTCEFGDAPASYGTLIAADGAAHVASGPTLGTLRDIEPDGQPGATATGDGADEDGIAGPIVITRNQASTVSVSATNDSNADVTLAGWIDLNGDGAFQTTERVTVTVPANSGTNSYQLDFPGGTARADTYARFRIFSEVIGDPQPTGSAAGGEVEDYAVTVLNPALSLEKISDATADTRPGDTVTYTVTASNTGTGHYTAGAPATITDDLSGVLDDAEFNNDATVSFSDGSTSAQPALTGSSLTWSGPLKVGETAIITYTATLQPGGDGQVNNSACVPDAEADGSACADTTTELPRLTISKTADTTELPVHGGVVTYTVTVTNAGPGDFTAAAPGTASDNLSNVLDDAAYNNDATASAGTISFDSGAQELNWSGPLAAGGTATIIYSVTYDSTGGDQSLVNVACVPAGLALDAVDPCRSVRIPGSALQTRKSADPASGTSVTGGQAVTYTLHFENTGQAAATVAEFDDASGVLDDATITTGPTASNPALTAVVNGSRIDIAGSVPAGATYTITYTVTVNAFAQQGDHVLANVLGGDANCLPNDTTCRTTNPINHVSVTKTSNATTGVNTGGTVTYTVTVTNDGAADYPADAPAAAVDDLTGVLDDAAFNNDATSTTGQLSYSAPALNWTGALGIGQSAIITYTVRVTNAGDHSLSNSAQALCTAPEICDPPVNVITLLPHVVPSKSSDPATGSGVRAGQAITYTLSFTNNGQAEGPVDSTDNLADVLDDAIVSSEPLSSVPAVTAVRSGDQIRTTGMIQPGQTVTVTYQVTIKPDGERGNNSGRNILTPDVPMCLVAQDCPPPATEHFIGELDAWKTVDPVSGTAVQPGKVMTYTLHFQNTGTSEVAVNKDDVLTQVLDDATITGAPVSSDPALTLTPVADGRFTVAGSLAPGQLVTVSYAVTVNPDGERGDDRLGNFLVNEGAEPAAECVPTNAERPACTLSYVSNIVVTKTADPGSGTKVMDGQDVTYTVTFTNTSTNEEAAEAVIAYTDHMKDVLDDATLKAGPNSTGNGVSATTSGETILFTGALASGDTAKVTYTVTVKPYAQGANHSLGNVVAATGEEPICAAGSPLCTDNPIDPLMVPVIPPGADLADTGAQAVGGLLLLGALLLAAGGSLIFIRRKAAQEQEGVLL